MVSADCQSFQFFRQINWFIRSNRALSKLTSRFLNFLISIIKLKKKKNQSIKSNFILTMRATLKFQIT